MVNNLTMYQNSYWKSEHLLFLPKHFVYNYALKMYSSQHWLLAHLHMYYHLEKNVHVLDAPAPSHTYGSLCISTNIILYAFLNTTLITMTIFMICLKSYNTLFTTHFLAFSITSVSPNQLQILQLF